MAEKVGHEIITSILQSEIDSTWWLGLYVKSEEELDVTLYARTNYVRLHDAAAEATLSIYMKVEHCDMCSIGFHRDGNYDGDSAV